ncbi:hypothetical protein [Bradyrhizobium sp. Ec3.3]|uniref:hypothetical protein n=2 Tax=unclassified Bradyrhizobium TaxID=2631580 RepID=UPI0006862540|nr:hypothetical protein [Bradyrhizobium sp. Ec3.3]
MKQMRLRNLAIASTFACAALLSFHWSEQSGVSLSIAGAQAQDGRAGYARGHGHRYGAGPYRYDAAGIAGPMAVNYAGLASAAGTPVAAGPGYGGTGPYGGTYVTPRGTRQYGAGPYRYDAAGIAGPMAANYAGLASAAGTPVAAGPGYGGTGPYGGIETKPFYLQRAYYGNGPWYGVNGWAAYKARYGIVCDPGTVTKGDDGHMHVCQ